MFVLKRVRNAQLAFFEISRLSSRFFRSRIVQNLDRVVLGSRSQRICAKWQPAVLQLFKQVSNRARKFKSWTTL
jgi:hypothetical protein